MATNNEESVDKVGSRFEKRTPDKVIRRGGVSGAGWVTRRAGRHNDQTNIRITFTRAYKVAGKWKDTKSFTPVDLPLLIEVATKMNAWSLTALASVE